LGWAGLLPETRARIMVLITEGRKIAAIREMRAATGLGLKGTKDIVEAVMAARN
jgi:ribosomal protein L7/L12